LTVIKFRADHSTKVKALEMKLKRKIPWPWGCCSCIFSIFYVTLYHTVRRKQAMLAINSFIVFGKRYYVVLRVLHKNSVTNAWNSKTDFGIIDCSVMCYVLWEHVFLRFPLWVIKIGVKGKDAQTRRCNSNYDTNLEVLKEFWKEKGSIGRTTFNNRRSSYIFAKWHQRKVCL
jgi:hypothetical protein